MNRRILICGGNGSGKSTLGKALADAMGIPFLDCEDYFFPETGLDCKYDHALTGKAAVLAIQRDVFFPETGLDYKYDHALTGEAAVPALQRDMERAEEWIFASIKGDYGERIESLFTHVILLADIQREIGMQRVWNRSQNALGGLMLPGGERCERERRFPEMVKGRAERDAEEWVSSLRCPVIIVNAMRPVKENVELLTAAFSKDT